MEDLCLLDLAKLIHEICAPYSAFIKYLLGQAIGKFRVTFSGQQTFLCMQCMWNHCHKDWSSTVSSTKWKQLSILGVVLAHSLCSTSHNLLIDWEHPSHGPYHKIGWLDDVHSAKWYADTHHMQLQSDSNEVLCGIILFIDQMFMADNDPSR